MTHAVYPSLAGKTVVISGGGSGIGEVIVQEFVRQKSKVFFLDVAETESKALVGKLGDGVRYLKCDVTDLVALRAALADIEAQAGPVAVLVNNAANDDRHKIEDVTPEYWENRIAVNLRHLYFASQAVSAGMKKAGGGSIINLRSVSWHPAIDHAIRTPRQMKLWHTPEEEAKILAQQCLKRRVDPVHVAAMVLFLASSDSAMCTAHNYWVDGGYR